MRPNMSFRLDHQVTVILAAAITVATLATCPVEGFFPHRSVYKTRTVVRGGGFGGGGPVVAYPGFQSEFAYPVNTGFRSESFFLPMTSGFRSEATLLPMSSQMFEYVPVRRGGFTGIQTPVSGAEASLTGGSTGANTPVASTGTGTTTTNVCAELKSSIDSLETRISSLESKVTGLENKVNTIIERLDKEEEQRRSAENNRLLLDEMDRRIKQNQADIIRAIVDENRKQNRLFVEILREDDTTKREELLRKLESGN